MARLLAHVNNHPHRNSASTRDDENRHLNSVEPHEGIEYNADTEMYHASYNGDTESVCLAVIETVAAVSETDPSELKPLYPVVDPDALNRLFAPKQDMMGRTDGEVRFTYCGYDVTVTSNGAVRVAPTEQ